VENVLVGLLCSQRPLFRNGEVTVIA